MAPPISKTSAEPTLYDILALTPKHLEGQAGAAQQQKIVKQAYHRALLKYHPDKASQGSGGSRNGDSTSSRRKQGSQPAPAPAPASAPRITYTVDQIQHAYAVLADRKQRAEYDRALRTHPSSSSFQTGVEMVDLDDLGFDERTGVYYRGCRCGNARGYAFTEENLEEFEDDGVLMVECLDCSLWIRVLFAAAASEDEEEDEGDDVALATTTSGGSSCSSPVGRRGGGGGGDTVTAAGERRGSGTGRGFTFNWSFNWGISLTGSATAGTGTDTSASRR
ncbi:uncharacterized protein F4812DRAFT_457587 [Daldinia caldariorum]|uniref:uncharacterized protein n=1 Tax=Daldinia caldariorum TaxID=326644 RepID=UPI002007A36A|nr:uncharacterized protein F4812DRAFT_457587 [Daldinia caldariorum]KAI1470196.1 hypothetical protein F4812DRAFT_457587 [Daldinia caldariorum]